MQRKHPHATDDIYSLGATLYELLTSLPPFHKGDIRKQILDAAAEPLDQRLAALTIENDVPKSVAAMIMACLAKDAEQRPQSAKALAEWVGPGIEAAASAVTVQFEKGSPSPLPSLPREGESLDSVRSKSSSGAEESSAETAAPAPETAPVETQTAPQSREKPKLLWGFAIGAILLILAGAWFVKMHSGRRTKMVLSPETLRRVPHGQTAWEWCSCRCRG